MLGGRALFKQNVAGIGDDFLAVARQPQAIFRRQVVQDADVDDGGRDLFHRRGSGGRCGSERKHRGASGEQI